MNYLKFENYYFIGIGGVGMSSLAEYMLYLNKKIEGYDRENSFKTKRLTDLGIRVIFSNNSKKINPIFKNSKNTIVVITPAIDKNNLILKYFKINNFTIIKRSDLLAEIVNPSFCIAIAGTHGKTTTTSILSHILYNSKLKFTSFIGGFLKKYDSNIMIKGRDIFLVEADEYDKTFLKLKPDIACVLNVDGDHYDIYNNIFELKNSFKIFANSLKENGILFHNSSLDFDGVSFGLNCSSDAKIINIKNQKDKSVFDIVFQNDIYKNIELNMLGEHNIFNAMVAFIIAISLKINPEMIIKSLKSFPGIKRRFSVELKNPRIFIDDYAHHPSEIDSLYNSLKSIYPNKKKLIIFQPHLFSRTQNFLNEFAISLERFDKVVLLDIYPARENPIEGVSSKSLLEKINNKNKVLITKNEVPKMLIKDDYELIVSVGAGDIGDMVDSIKKTLIENYEV